jgi:hypothetical protein
MTLPLRLPPAPCSRPRLLLLYCRPAGDFAVQDGHVAQLQRTLGAQLDVETVSPSAAAQRHRTWVSATQPTLLVLRGEQIVAIAVGNVPLRELDGLVARALA